MTTGTFSTAWALALLWYATGALADGECAKGYRDTTAAERATMTNVLTIALAALPPAPTGWVVSYDGEKRGPLSICRDGETLPWVYSIRRDYGRVDDREARDQAFKAAADKVNAEQAKKQPRIDALNARLSELGGQVGAAIQKNDLARAQALQKEVETVTAQLQAVYDENDQSAVIEAAGVERARDTEITIQVRVNPTRESPNTTRKPITLPAGVQAAYRWSDDAPRTQDHALLLLGTWKPAANGGFESAPRSGATPVVASSLAIQVDADPGRIESIVGAIKITDVAATLH